MHLTLIQGGDEPEARRGEHATGAARAERWLETVDPALRVRLSVRLAGLTSGVRERTLAELEPVAAAGLRTEAEIRAALSAATPAPLAVAVCRLVACVGDASTTPALRRLLRDASCARVRCHAAYAIARLGGDGARGALTEALLHDDDEEVRARAARGLGSLGDHRAVSVLCAMVADGGETAGVRSEAAESLGRLGRRSATPQLVRALRDPAPDVRAGAANALGLMAGLEAVPALRALRDDRAVVPELGPVAECAAAAIVDIRRRALVAG